MAADVVVPSSGPRRKKHVPLSTSLVAAGSLIRASSRTTNVVLVKVTLQQASSPGLTSIATPSLTEVVYI